MGIEARANFIGPIDVETEFEGPMHSQCANHSINFGDSRDGRGLIAR